MAPFSVRSFVHQRMMESRQIIPTGGDAKAYAMSVFI